MTKNQVCSCSSPTCARGDPAVSGGRHPPPGPAAGRGCTLLKGALAHRSGAFAREWCPRRRAAGGWRCPTTCTFGCPRPWWPPGTCPRRGRGSRIASRGASQRWGDSQPGIWCDRTAGCRTQQKRRRARAGRAGRAPCPRFRRVRTSRTRRTAQRTGHRQATPTSLLCSPAMRRRKRRRHLQRIQARNPVKWTAMTSQWSCGGMRRNAPCALRRRRSRPPLRQQPRAPCASS